MCRAQCNVSGLGVGSLSEINHRPQMPDSQFKQIAALAAIGVYVSFLNRALRASENVPLRSCAADAPLVVREDSGLGDGVCVFTIALWVPRRLSRRALAGFRAAFRPSVRLTSVIATPPSGFLCEPEQLHGKISSAGKACVM